MGEGHPTEAIEMVNPNNSTTAESVALQLLHIVAHAENKSLHEGVTTGQSKPDREWIIQTYRECLLAVQHPQQNPRDIMGPSYPDSIGDGDSEDVSNVAIGP
jgi:hypothetical protein